MMVGLFEPHAAAWAVDGIPRDRVVHARCKPDWDRMAPFLEKAMARVPVTLEVGVRTFFCGPESFTPDLMPAVGEAPGIRELLRRRRHELRRRAVRRRPRPGARALDHRRAARRRRHRLGTSPASAPTSSSRRTAATAPPRSSAPCTPRTRRASSCAPRATGCSRPCTTGSSRNGGLLREVSGWEGADWFAGPGVAPEAEPTWGRAPWFEQWEAEHRTVREGVGLMDMSFMAKFRVTGADAGARARPPARRAT